MGQCRNMGHQREPRCGIRRGAPRKRWPTSRRQRARCSRCRTRLDRRRDRSPPQRRRALRLQSRLARRHGLLRSRARDHASFRFPRGPARAGRRRMPRLRPRGRMAVSAISTGRSSPALGRPAYPRRWCHHRNNRSSHVAAHPRAGPHTDARSADDQQLALPDAASAFAHVTRCVSPINPTRCPASTSIEHGGCTPIPAQRCRNLIGSGGSEDQGPPPIRCVLPSLRCTSSQELTGHRHGTRRGAPGLHTLTERDRNAAGRDDARQPVTR